MVRVSKYEGMTAVVTGAGSGIGRELAKQLVQEGCSVALCDIREDLLLETMEECRATRKSESIHVLGSGKCDVSSIDDILKFKRLVLDNFGGSLNMLFNNAGMVSNGSFLDFEAERFQRVLDVNLKGVIEMTRAFLPLIIQSKVGYVVNVSSANALWCCLGPAKFPFEALGHTAYCAAKAGVKGFTEALLHDSFQNFSHIGVVCVHPGKVDTNVFLHAEPSKTSNIEQHKSFLSLPNQNKALIHSLESLSSEELHKAYGENFKNTPGTSPKEAAKYILSQVRQGNTRILVGDDAVVLDILCRAFPRLVYSDYFQTTVLLPWVALAHIFTKYFGPGPGRFAYPVLISILLTALLETTKKLGRSLSKL